MQFKDRLNELKSNDLGFQCLNPGFKRGHNGLCFNKFNCPDTSHKKFDVGYHVLVCDAHKSDMNDHELLEEYKSKQQIIIAGTRNLVKIFQFHFMRN